MDRRNERWPFTEPNSSLVCNPTKASFDRVVYEPSFPVLAMTADSGGGAFVCITPSFKAFGVQTVSFRFISTRSGRVDAMVKALESHLDQRAPSTVVVERRFGAQIDRAAPEIARRTARLARERGLRVRSMSLAEASARILDERPDEATLRRASAALATRYPALAQVLAPDGRSRLRDTANWRRHRALLGAFCLAHAASLELFLGAVQRQANPKKYE